MTDELADASASLTVFAPTDAAFAAAPPGLTIPQLTTVPTYHVLADEVLSSQLGPVYGNPAATVSGQSITINAGTAPVIATITDTTAAPATITAVDVRASNGVIRVIDKVLFPNPVTVSRAGPGRAGAGRVAVGRYFAPDKENPR